MCTVTVFRPSSHKTIVTMNRDEARTREQELPPRHLDGEEIIAPLDTQSGGTWIAVSKGGIWACLLNGYLEDGELLSDPAKYLSRGTIIPWLLIQDDPFAALQNLDCGPYASFRLWLGQDAEITEAFWDGQDLTLQNLSASPWAFVTSSSYKQNAVKAYREKRFQAFLASNAPFTEQGLPAIHLDYEEAREDFGILMARENAVTKSITQIAIKGAHISMSHRYRDQLDKEPVYIDFPNAENPKRGRA